MKITAQRTGERMELDGVPVETWRGRTAAGVSCMLFVLEWFGPVLSEVVVENGDLTDLGGIPCRRWNGRSDAGPYQLLVHRVVPERGQEAEFDRELKLVPAPKTAGGLDDTLLRELPVVTDRSIDLRQVL